MAEEKALPRYAYDDARREHETKCHNNRVRHKYAYEAYTARPMPRQAAEHFLLPRGRPRLATDARDSSCTSPQDDRGGA